MKNRKPTKATAGKGNSKAKRPTKGELTGVKDEFCRKHPDGVLARLIREKRISWWSKDTCGINIVLIKGSVKETEGCVVEMCNYPPDYFSINMEGRELDAMFIPVPSDGAPLGAITCMCEIAGAYDIALVAHEAVHAANWILNMSRQPHDFGSRDDGHAGEPVAYIVGSIVEKWMIAFHPELEIPMVVDSLTGVLRAINNRNEKPREIGGEENKG